MPNAIQFFLTWEFALGKYSSDQEGDVCAGCHLCPAGTLGANYKDILREMMESMTEAILCVPHPNHDFHKQCDTVRNPTTCT
jgi:hypothetical protein